MKAAEEGYRRKLDEKAAELEKHEKEFELAEKKKAAAEAELRVKRRDDSLISDEINKVLNSKLRAYKSKLDEEVIKEATE